MAPETAPSTWDEVTFTSSLRDNLFEVALALLRDGGVTSIGLVRQPNNANEAVRCLINFEGPDIEERLRRFSAFRGRQDFVWPRVSAETWTRIRQLWVSVAWMQKPVADLPNGGLDAHGLRLKVEAHCKLHSSVATETRALEKAAAACTHQHHVPRMPWLHAMASQAPRGYGCSFLITPTDIKERVTQPDSPYWWA
ncbi:MAG: hypothetical protein EPN31_16255 [Castellaniella sp.]|uniref:hypothetical protein n=1 Tax=Castellaniella sp. TaxID=1955812 RepID=UPI00121FC57C|nr:hypothetical protein [Castellaniella sp.]TAN24990.1 MAG: hypothetical protein EPN31_16255 [Castellaniella sp.]